MLAARKRLSNRWRRDLAAALLTALTLTSAARAGDEGIAEDSVAAAIRGGGYPCARVVDMERSKEGAAEGFIVWKVRCNSGRFKVTFKGDTGSEVVRLE